MNFFNVNDFVIYDLLIFLKLLNQLNVLIFLKLGYFFYLLNRLNIMGFIFC